jgi:uncharacterized protein YkwD
MKTKPLLCVLAGVFGFLLASCSSNLEVTRVPVGATGGRERALANRINDEVNAYRRSKGGGELSRMSGLDQLAQQHSEFMKANRGKFSLYGKNVTHYGFESRAALARNNFNLEEVSENVIAGERLGGDVAKALVDGWKGSPNHDHNMTQAWNCTGVGVAVDEQGNIYATQLFATRSSHQSQWAGPARQF